MQLKDRILILLLLLFLIFNFIGCAKCISTEYESVEVTIMDKYHRGSYMTPVRAGKVTTFVTHPAVWRIIVDYNGVNYSISGRETYDKYKDKIGQIIIGEVMIKTYDDGTVKYDIVSLE